MPGIQPPAQVYHLQQVDELGKYFSTLESMTYNSYEMQFADLERRFYSGGNENLLHYVRRSGELFEDWQDIKKNLVDDYATLQKSRKLEYEMLYRKLVEDERKSNQKSTLDEVFDYVVENIFGKVFGLETKTKTPEAKAQNSSNPETSVDETRKIYIQQVERRLSERDSSFRKFKRLMETSAERINRKFKSEFNDLLEKQVVYTRQKRESRVEILRDRQRIEEAIRNFHPKGKINSYLNHMVYYTYETKLLDVEEKTEVAAAPAVIEKPREVRDAKLVAEVREVRTGPCHNTEVPAHLIRLCKPDYLVLDLKANGKKSDFEMLKLHSFNVRERYGAVRYFSKCSHYSLEAESEIRNMLDRPGFTASEEVFLRQSLDKISACKK